MPSRLCVVAHNGNSIRRQQLSAKGQQALAYRFRNPGINSVRNDVIKLAELGSHIQQVALKDAHILEAKLANTLLPALNGQTSQIESYKLAARDGIGHRNEIRALVAGNLKHAALLH